jgi:hypothetical protein
MLIKYGQPEHMRKLYADQAYAPMTIGSMPAPFTGIWQWSQGAFANQE